MGGWIGGYNGDNSGGGDATATASCEEDNNPSPYFTGALDASSLVREAAANQVENGETKQGSITNEQYQSNCCWDTKATTNCIQHPISCSRGTYHLVEIKKYWGGNEVWGIVFPINVGDDKEKVELLAMIIIL